MFCKGIHMFGWIIQCQKGEETGLLHFVCRTWRGLISVVIDKSERTRIPKLLLAFNMLFSTEVFRRMHLKIILLNHHTVLFLALVKWLHDHPHYFSLVAGLRNRLIRPNVCKISGMKYEAVLNRSYTSENGNSNRFKGYNKVSVSAGKLDNEGRCNPLFEIMHQAEQ